MLDEELPTQPLNHVQSGIRCRVARERSGRTQASVIAQCGLYQTELSHYERGRRDLNSNFKKKRLALALGVSELWLYGQEIPGPEETVPAVEETAAPPVVARTSPSAAQVPDAPGPDKVRVEVPSTMGAVIALLEQEMARAVAEADQEVAELEGVLDKTRQSLEGTLSLARTSVREFSASKKADAASAIRARITGIPEDSNSGSHLAFLVECYRELVKTAQEGLDRVVQLSSGSGTGPLGKALASRA